MIRKFTELNESKKEAEVRFDLNKEAFYEIIEKLKEEVEKLDTDSDKNWAHVNEISDINMCIVSELEGRNPEFFKEIKDRLGR